MTIVVVVVDVVTIVVVVVEGETVGSAKILEPLLPIIVLTSTAISPPFGRVNGVKRNAACSI